jgi:hypothetical protein
VVAAQEGLVVVSTITVSSEPISRHQQDKHQPASTVRLVAELPAICQQQGFTSPQAAPCRFDSVGVLTSANSRERTDTC